MSRLLNAMKTDARIQVRNNLYAIGLGVAAVTAVVLAWLGNGEQLGNLIPTLLLIVVGGTTFLYVGSLIFFEQEQGTLYATIVSPLRPAEYLWSKVLTLSGLATLEAVVLAGSAMLIFYFTDTLHGPNILLLLLGIVVIAFLYTLMGIVLMVRYRRFSDYLMPMAIVISVLQLPFLYFWGVIEEPVLLLIPTSAPAMLMKGAFVALEGWQWAYGLGYSALLLLGLSFWALSAYRHYMVRKVG